MKHLVQFPLEDGSSIVVELDEPETSGAVPAGRGDIIARAKETLDDAFAKVLPVTKSVVEKLRSMGDKPDEIEVTLGVKLSTVAGAVIASASAEANFGVTLRWTEKARESTH